MNKRIDILKRNRTVFLILAIVSFSIAVFYVAVNPEMVQELLNHMTQIEECGSEEPTLGFKAGVVFILSVYFILFIPSILGIILGIIFTCISIVNAVKYKKALQEFKTLNNSIFNNNGGTL
jgi:hypothetical protein